MSARYLLLTPVEPAPAGWRPLRGVSTGAYAWRLLGANNRELGRSAGVFPDRDACERAIVDAAARAAEAAHVISHDGPTGTWSWRLDGPHGTFARAARGYARQRECHYGLSVFREQAAGAEVLVRPRSTPGRRAAPAGLTPPRG